MKYDIREIKEKDNKEVESLIRTCLIELCTKKVCVFAGTHTINLEHNDSMFIYM